MSRKKSFRQTVPSKKFKIPPRWLKCPPKSFELLKNKFLIFKTPLSSRYDKMVKDDIFQVPLVFQSMKNRKVKLGLWIDLTNTTRYYDKEEVERNGSKYVKIQCQGHKGTPSVAQSQSFIKLCHNFIRQFPLEVIGVHCTHGFNRSGFLVVSYLVEKMDWELGAAIAEFARIRPPGIYKQDYLVELYRRYDDVGYAPTAPPLPDWCYEEEEEEDKEEQEEQEEEGESEGPNSTNCVDGEDVDDDSNGESGENARKGGCRASKRSLIPPKFMDGVTGVKPVMGPSKEEIQKAVKQMCEWKRSDFPGCQPVSLGFHNIHLLSEKPYSVSWKADGVRYMLYIKNKNQVYCIDRDNNIFFVDNMKFPYRKDLRMHVANTLLDGEMVLDKQGDGSMRPRYLIYDAIVMNNYSIKNNTFDIRYKAIEKEIYAPREEAFMKGLLNKQKEPFSIRRKEFRDIIDAKKYLSDSFKKLLSHPPDGLIFQPSREPYVPGQCKEVLKWKPLSLNSVDFKLKIETESGVGILKKSVGKLYTGGNVLFGDLLSLKNAKHLDSKIVECTYDRSTNKWLFLRERTDKSFPNSFDTALSVCQSIKNPVTEKILLEFIANQRYRE